MTWDKQSIAVLLILVWIGLSQFGAVESAAYIFSGTMLYLWYHHLVNKTRK